MTERGPLTERELELVEIVRMAQRAFVSIMVGAGDARSRQLAREADERISNGLKDFPVDALWGEP